MGIKLKIWLDSGANIHSRREQVVSLDELEITDSEWARMNDEEKEDAIRDIAFDKADWGFNEIDG